MITHVRSTVLFAFAAMVCSTAHPNDAIPLLKDSFEEGAASPEGWSKGAAINGVKYLYDKRIAKTGERSLGLQKSAQRYFPIAQWVRTLPHSEQSSTLKVTTQVRAQKATKAIVDVIFQDEDGKTISHEWANYIGSKNDGDPPANHDWKEYSAFVDIPQGTKQISIALQVYGPGSVWFDDVEVTYANADTKASTKNKSELDPHSIEAAVEIEIGTGKGKYLYADALATEPPAEGKGLLVVLPGGNGSADFFPFIQRMHQQAANDQLCLAQPIARKWTEDQNVVWPTSSNRSEAMDYTTEELVDGVIRDVAKRTRLNPKRIYVMAWSSGGPAAYASMLQPRSLVRGGLIAMSVFKPDQLPPMQNAKERRFYLLHSPEDRICPFSMAEEAKQALSEAGASTKLVTYDGGHGWHGDVYANIRNGIEWLEKAK